MAGSNRSNPTPESDDQALKTGCDQGSEADLRQSLEQLSQSRYLSISIKASKDLIDLEPKLDHQHPTHPSESVVDEVSYPPLILSRHATAELPAQDPDQPVRLLRQKKMINALQAYGPVGLVDTIYQECNEDREKGNKNIANETLVLDCEQKDYHAIQLLYTLPQSAMISMIKNTLPYDLHQDKALDTFCQIHMQVCQHAGIYLNQIVSPHPDHHARWLSTTEISQLIKAYKGYIKDDPSSSALNDAIDCQFGGERGTRRYAKDDAQKGKGRTFCRMLRHLYCQFTPEARVEERHSRAPSEIGWSQDISRRVPQHLRNGSTTYIFGFVNAFAQLARSQGGLGYGQPVSFCVFPIWKKIKALARTGEALAWMLTGSYAWYGGYNCDHAAKFSIQLDVNDSSWSVAQSKVKARLVHLHCPDMWEEHGVDFATSFFKLRKCPQLDAELTVTKSNVEIAKTRYIEAEKKVEKSRENVKRKDGPYQESRDSYWKRLNEITPQGQEPFGDRLRNIVKRHESHLRVQEEIQRCFRIRSGHVASASNRPGPAVTRQPLSDDERQAVATSEMNLRDLVDKEYERRQRIGFADV